MDQFLNENNEKRQETSDQDLEIKIKKIIYKRKEIWRIVKHVNKESEKREVLDSEKMKIEDNNEDEEMQGLVKIAKVHGEKKTGKLIMLHSNISIALIGKLYYVNIGIIPML